MWRNNAVDPLYKNIALDCDPHCDLTVCDRLSNRSCSLFADIFYQGKFYLGVILPSKRVTPDPISIKTTRIFVQDIGEHVNAVAIQPEPFEAYFCLSRHGLPQYIPVDEDFWYHSCGEEK